MFTLSLALAVALAGAPKASGPKKTLLKIEVRPASAIVYVDGKRKGTGAKAMSLSVEPGRHTIRIVQGRDEHQEVVAVKKGETTNWSWTFEDDRKGGQPSVPEPDGSGPPKEPSEPGKEK
jgi:hypothetical protein